MGYGAGEDRHIKDVAEAREWLTENLTGRLNEHSQYYAGFLAYIRRLPDNDPELARTAALLVTYDRDPGRRPDISLSGDDDDTADVIGEVLDDDEERHDTLESLRDSEAYLGSDAEPGDLPTLPRDSYAAFLHGLLDRMEIWLADDAEIGRSAE
jgi:hypothetical protein